MLLDFDVIPFFLDTDATNSSYSLFAGTASGGSSGVMRFEDGSLILEFVTNSSEYSLTSYKQKISDVQTRTIPLSAVQSLEVKRWKFKNDTGDWKHFWNPKLVITTRSLKALEGIPTAKGNTLILTLESKGFSNARAFSAQLSTVLAEERLLRIEANSAHILPPKQ